MRSTSGILLLLLTSLTMCSGAPAPLDWDGETSDIITWTLVGPFMVAPGEDVTNVDYTAPLGLTEEEVSRSLPAVPTTSPHQIHVALGADRPILDLNAIFGREYDNGPATVCYAIAVIRCSRATPAYLLYSSSDAASVWLNGRRLVSEAGHQGLRRFERCLTLNLDRGGNTVMFKVPRWSVGWGLAAAIAPSADAAAELALASQGLKESLLLATSMVGTAKTIHFQPLGVPGNARFRARIHKAGKSSIEYEGIVSPGQSVDLPTGVLEGLYEFQVFIGKSAFSEHFCVGDPRAIFETLTHECRFTTPNGERMLVPLLTRFAVLFKPENLPAHTDRSWERRVLFVLREAELLSMSSDIAATASGLHLRSFISRIDGVRQYYRFCIPSVAARQRVPVLIIMATAVSSSRPFIESAFVASQVEAERWEYIAEQHGVAILWPGYRCQPTNSPIEFAGYNEALDDFLSEQNVDPRRVTVFGTCSGGAIATAYASEFPWRFASVALLDASFKLAHSLSGEADEWFNGRIDYEAWKGASNTIQQFVRTGRRPALVLFDGSEPDHGTLDDTKQFTSAIAAAGIPFEYYVEHQGLSQHFSSYDHVLRWCATREVARVPRAPVAAGERWNESSVAVALSRPFEILAPGNKNSHAGAAALRLADEICRAWQETNFGTPYLRHDNISAGKVALIVGDMQTAPWTQKIPDRELRLTDDGVAIRGKIIAGKHLTVICSLRDATGNAVVIITSNSWDSAQLGCFDLSRTGWYRYAVWDTSLDALHLIDAGL